VNQKAEVRAWNFNHITPDLEGTHSLEVKTLIKNPDINDKNLFAVFDMFLNRALSVMYGLMPDGKYIVASASHIMCKSIKTPNHYCKAIEILLTHALNLREKQKEEKIFRPLTKVDLTTVPKVILKPAKLLTCEQLAGLCVFLHFSDIDSQEHSKWKHQLQGPAFPLDIRSVLIWCVATGDRWKIKQLFGPLLMAGSGRGHSGDPSLVSFDLVKSNRCYKRVLDMISSDGTKVLMKQPGEITFVPVKHCRWCGLIKVEKFRLCSMCLECPEYLDVNYFCSEKCEAESLDSKHREEHARYYMVKLGLEN
jgi:hypothetical protein